MKGSRVHVLAVADGFRLTGPARQLLASRRCANASITLAVFQRSRRPTPLITFARQLNVPTLALPDRFPGDPRAIAALARLAAGPETDILQTHGYKANVLAALVNVRARRPWVAFLHGETWESRKVRFYFAMERLAIRRADRIVVVSHQMARALESGGIPPSKLRVIHNACLINPPTDDGAAGYDGNVPPIIGVVGRLSYEKGVDIALEVHRRVVRQHPSARLWVIGEGPEQMRLARLADRLGLSPSVDWLGYQEEMGPLYQRMAVLLLASRSEGLPNVALEAMAHGVPVVATAAGGVPEIISDGQTGFLVPSGDPQGLAARVVELLADVQLRRRLGHAARDEVRTRFSLEARCQALARLYDEAAA